MFWFSGNLVVAGAPFAGSGSARGRARERGAAMASAAMRRFL